MARTCSIPSREHRRLPERSGGTRAVGSPFLCLLSFGEAKESESPAGANSRLRPSNNSKVQSEGSVPSPQPSPGGRGSKSTHLPRAPRTRTRVSPSPLAPCQRPRWYLLAEGDGCKVRSRFTTLEKQMTMPRRLTLQCAALATALLCGGTFAQTKEVTFAHQDMLVPLRLVMESGEVEKATGYKINWRMFVGRRRRDPRHGLGRRADRRSRLQPAHRGGQPGPGHQAVLDPRRHRRRRGARRAQRHQHQQHEGPRRARRSRRPSSRPRTTS